MIKKRNLLYSEFCHPGRPQNENQRKQKERQVLGPCHRTKKAMEHKGNCFKCTNYNWYTWNDLQRIGKGVGRVGNQKARQGYPTYC